MDAATKSPMPAAAQIPASACQKGLRTYDIYVPDLHIDIIKTKSRNFH
jgi:error-prone DNA polymerase